MSAHRWGHPDDDGVQRCVAESCTVRRSLRADAWQRAKGGHWRKQSREPMPPCMVRAASAVRPEPAPKRTDSPAVWPLVIADAPRVLDETPAPVLERLTADMRARDADMRARDAEGRRKYGTPLQVESGRNAAVDAYQEALDLTVYARQRWERHHTRAWWLIHEGALKLAARICFELLEEGR